VSEREARIGEKIAGSGAYSVERWILGKEFSNLGRFPPVPVRQVATVAAFVTQCTLKAPYIVAVPSEKGAAKVNISGLIDMNGHKVVVAGFGTRCQALWYFRRSSHETFYYIHAEIIS
jgi:hypothetical protein